jgi:hypothetical protein
VDVATDAPLWSDNDSGTMGDEVQERVSREIVRALGVRLTSDEMRRLGDRPIADPRAYEFYLRARQELRRYAVPTAVPLSRPSTSPPWIRTSSSSRGVLPRRRRSGARPRLAQAKERTEAFTRAAG